MFAGAVREAVFSVPQVIRKVQKEYIPLALSANLVNGQSAKNRDESRFYKRIRASMPAPQGVGVINSAGEVLDWVLTFDKDENVMEFLDYTINRFREHPDETVDVRRYSPYPGKKLDDHEPKDDYKAYAEGHGDKACPSTYSAKARARKGDLWASVCGRLLKDGELIKDTVRQEHYSQDFFLVTKEMQEQLKFEDGADLPKAIATRIVTYAYLGHIDVRPIDNARRGTHEIKRLEFTIHKHDRTWWRIEGKSDVEGELKGRGGHYHRVTLDWRGFLKADGTAFRIIGVGEEALRYGRDGGDADEVRSLPAGRKIDMKEKVRYGIEASRVEEDQVRAGETGKGNEGQGGLQKKMKRVQELMQKKEGRRREAHKHIREFQKLMEEGRRGEAEEALDRAIEVLER